MVSSPLRSGGRVLPAAGAGCALLLALTGCGSTVRDAPPTAAVAQVPTGTPIPAESSGNPRATPPPALRAAAGAGSGPAAAAVPPPVSLSIPAVGIRSQLVRLGLNRERALEVPSDYGLAGWFTGGPRPGETGPAVIAGHVDSRTGPAVFYRLRDLRPGHRITVQRRDGTAATFAVTAVAQYPKNAFPTAEVYGPVPQPELRLITCGGSFDRERSSYRSNLVVSASLTS